MERINGTRDLICGIALSLLIHGALLGLPFSSGGQRLIPPHQSNPLELSLVELKGHEDARPKMKLVPLAQPERVRQSVSISKRKVTKRREQSSVDLEEKSIPLLGEKPIILPKEEKILTPTPEPLPSASGRKIVDNVPQPEEEGAGKAALPGPLPLAQNPIKEDLRASFTPGADSSRSNPMTLARPRYNRSPKPPYPRIARRRGYEGVVVLKVEILSNGRVGEVRVKRSSGHHILDRSALKTVKKWKFIPAKRGEDPIRIWAEIPIKFDLE